MEAIKKVNKEDYQNGKVINKMKYYFRAVKYIMKYGGYESNTCKI